MASEKMREFIAETFVSLLFIAIWAWVTRYLTRQEVEERRFEIFNGSGWDE